MAKQNPELTPEALACIERDHAHRRVALWQLPILPDSDIAFACGLAGSTWQALKSSADKPQLFNIGRRVFARTSDLRAWLDRKATAPTPE